MIQSTLTQLTLHSAVHLAAKGEYRAASLLIASVAKDEMPVSLQMLHAKILVQQGKYCEAIDAWRDLLQKEPDNREAQAALRRTETLAQGGWHWLGRYSTGFKVLMLATLLGAAGLAAAPYSGLSFPRLVSQAAAEKSPSALPGPDQYPSYAGLLRRTTELERTVREQTALLSSQLRAVEDGVQRKTETPVAHEDVVTGAVAELREQLSALEKTTSQQTSQAMTTLDRRLAVLEKGVQNQNEQIARAEKRSDDAHRAYRNSLVARLSDLCRKQPLAEADVTAIRLTARALQDLAPDTESQDYANRVVEWVETVKPQTPDTDNQNQVGRQQYGLPQGRWQRRNW
jgi:hypothetical protein